MAKLLPSAYKSKIIKFKLDQDPLQRRICFLTFVESPKTIFSQYKETCELLLDCPKIEGDNIKDKKPLGIIYMKYWCTQQKIHC